MAAIKGQQEEERIRTRKRLRTLYSLLGAAMIALVVAVVFYFSSKRSEKEATDALAQYKTEQAAKQKVQAEKDKNEFISLESRANIILSANGCPKAITYLMDSISKINPDSINMRLKIKAIEETAQSKGYCK